MAMKTRFKFLALVLGFSLLAISNVQAAASVTFYHHDALGSVIATSNQYGDLDLNEEYQPYGEKIYGTEDSSSGNEDWYTGKNYSKELDLTYFGARWYDAKQGRFLSIDPAPVVFDQVHSFNRYVYSNNNPYSFVDPNGENAVTAFGGLITETGSFLTGGGFDGAGVLSALVDGYNGQGEGFASSAYQDATEIIPVGKIGGFASKAYSGIRGVKGTKSANRLVIGRGGDLAKPGALKPGEKKLSWPPTGTVKSEWKTNSGLLRQEMGKGKPIRDASPDNNKGMYLNAERNLLKDRGWSFDSKTNYWTPPQ
jgi:RHS repeat-associated protein